MVALIEAVDGVIVGEPAVVFQSDKLNITGVGRVDLSSEKLDAKFSTQARKGIGIAMSDLVSPFTEVGGTLARPTLQLDTEGVLFEGTAAVATLGASLPMVAEPLVNRKRKGYGKLSSHWRTGCSAQTSSASMAALSATARASSTAC